MNDSLSDVIIDVPIITLPQAETKRNNLNPLRIAKVLLISSALLIFITVFTIYLLWNRHLKLAKIESIENIPHCNPYNFVMKKESLSTMEFSWETRGECSSYIKLYVDGMEQTFFTNNGEIPASKHSLKIGSLESNRTYRLKVVSNNVEFGIDGNMILFKTDATHN